MKEIIPPTDKSLLLKELTEDKFIRKTNFGGNDLYVFTHHEAPNLMREVGRLRELTFREAGGGTGFETDIDDFDISDDPYHQLIVWDPQHNEILGGYRFYLPHPNQAGSDIAKRLSTSHLFTFSEQFQNDYMPFMIELGRSFVQPLYQSTARARKGIFALDNLWDGLGALVVEHPNMKYFFGKVTMYTHFNQNARNILLYFLKKYFPDPDKLVTPLHQIELNWDELAMKKLFSGSDYKENYKILSKEIRALKENIPPLINAYMNLSPSMKTFGTSINNEFGEVEETGILVTVADIYPEKVERHVSNYQRVRYFLKKDKLFPSKHK